MSITGAALAELRSLFPKVHHRSGTNFLVYTTEGKPISVTILDAGPKRPQLRYSVKATTEDGRRATGNPAESIDLALDIVHWQDVGLTWGGTDSRLQPMDGPAPPAAEDPSN